MLMVSLNNLTKEYGIKPRQKKQSTLEIPVINFDIPWGFLDSLCQGDLSIDGVGVVLLLNQNH